MPKRYDHDKLDKYITWMRAVARKSLQVETVASRNEYAREAFRPVVTADGATVTTFAPFDDRNSARHTILPQQVLFFCLTGTLLTVLLWCWFFPVVQGIWTALFLFYLWHFFSLFKAFWVLLRAEEPEDRMELIKALDHAQVEWPMYSLLCPMYHEAHMIPAFVKAIEALDYPLDKLEVLFLTESDDLDVRLAIEAESLLPTWRTIIVPAGSPKTKPRACNYGLTHAQGDFITIYDIEDRPDPLQLKLAILKFAESDPTVACVQAKLNFYNPLHNVLTRFFTIEYSFWFDVMLPVMHALGLDLPLGGTSNHFPADVLRSLRGWDAFNVTEDADLGIRLAQQGFSTALIDSTTYEEANSDVRNWIRQRRRWMKGYMQTYLVHMRHPIQDLKKGRGKTLLSLQLMVGWGTAAFFVNPVMWALLIIYFIFRARVGVFYHDLFSVPLLYVGTVSLIFGNFCYLYLAMLSCTKRNYYTLLLWCPLLPVYWLLMSVAAVQAAWQLVVRPHYWDKTLHGSAIHQKHAHTLLVEEDEDIQDLFTSRHAAITPVSTLTQSVKAMLTRPVPAIGKESLGWKSKIDIWTNVLICISLLFSILATLYSFVHHDILIYGDAYTHMHIARSIFDSVTPGIAQFGGVWLPLPHILMLPFIWNTYLWTTGLAGSIPSMLCYVGASVFLFLSARRFTNNDLGSLAGVLIFILNPNILYLQTTPLSEPICFLTFSFASYCFIRWTEKYELKFLVLSAFGSFLATLSRYDGWFLFLSMFLLMVVIDLVKRKTLRQILSDVLIMGSLGSIGIVLWLVWNKIIFGDFLYFQHGVYSSQAQMQNFYANDFGTRGNLILSIRYYFTAILDTFGFPILVLGLLSLGWFMFSSQPLAKKLASLTFLSPLAFYAFSFYSGQVIIMVPGVSNSIFNARFGTEAALPLAFFIATCLRPFSKTPKRIMHTLLPVILIIFILFESVSIARSGIISLEDGQYGLSCVGNDLIDLYLSKHYNGGMILEDTYLGSPNEGAEVGIPLKNIIYQGSGQYWQHAIQNPSHYVQWIIVGVRSQRSAYPIQVDLNSVSFKEKYALVSNDHAQNSTAKLYVLKTLLSQLPNRNADAKFNNEYPYCGTGKRPSSL